MTQWKPGRSIRNPPVLLYVFGRQRLAPRQPPLTGHHLIHYGREAVTAGGDGDDVVAKREAVERNGRDAVAFAVNAGKSGGAGLGEIAGVAAVVVFAAQSTCSAGPVPFPGNLRVLQRRFARKGP